MISADQFDQDYFEDGIRKRKSLYENFRWMPWLSLPIASTLKNMYPGNSFLDYGCGKGFLVYAFRLLSVTAWGYDISEYAIKNCKPEVKDFIFLDKAKVPGAGVVIVKDALEHNSYEQIDDELGWIASKCYKACFVVPFGENGRYRIQEYNFDITHIITEDEEWWAKKIIKAGFIIDEFGHTLKGFKENWYGHNPKGNGVYLCTRRR